jgi:hypothetical protein
MLFSVLLMLVTYLLPITTAIATAGVRSLSYSFSYSVLILTT